MEIQVSKQLNEELIKLQKLIKQATGKHEAKRKLLVELTTITICDGGEGEYSKTYTAIDLSESVLISYTFDPINFNIITRIKKATGLSSHQVINALALAALPDYRAKYDTILSLINN